MADVINQTMKLKRADGKIVDAIFYDNSDISTVDILDIANRQNFGKRALEPFKEKWQLFIHNDATRLTGAQTRDGILALPLTELKAIATRIGAVVPTGDFRLPGTRGLRISNEKEKTILAIWYKLCK